MSVCDFCSAPNPVRLYPARDGLTAGSIGPDGEGVAMNSRGAWGACAECARLIDCNDREALHQRACERLFALYPDRGLDAATARIVIGHTHDRFFELREFPPQGAAT